MFGSCWGVKCNGCVVLQGGDRERESHPGLSLCTNTALSWCVCLCVSVHICKCVVPCKYFVINIFTPLRCHILYALSVCSFCNCMFVCVCMCVKSIWLYSVRVRLSHLCVCVCLCFWCVPKWPLCRLSAGERDQLAA